MTSKEWHTVNGTLFGFPELPPREEIAPEVYAKWTAERTAILENAAAVKYRKPTKTRRGFKGPKPGDGVFEPKAGAPGSRVAVTVCVTDRNGMSPVKVAEVEHEGCVMFPAPRGGCGCRCGTAGCPSRRG